MKRMTSTLRHGTVALSAAFLAFCAAGGCNSAGIPDDTGQTGGDGVGTVAVQLAADFGANASGKLSAARAKELCPSSAPAMDGPMYQGEQDCDGDGGIVRYITPSAYKIAVKRLAFENADGVLVDIIVDTGTLANAEVLDLTAAVTLPVLSLPIGEYPNFYAELYYHELTMPLYDPADPDTLRVYVSDDSFPAEGNLGHHQGDITLLDVNDTELGFVPAGDLWQPALLETTRGAINGAGGTDPETGHLRGLYGNLDRWNVAALAQGPGQDIFIIEGELDLVLDEAGGSVTFSFDVQDAWFFEDFDNDQWFNPCEGGTLDGCGGEWSPVLNDPEVLVE